MAQFFTLILLISFASVNAVLFTPALPDIALYFGINHNLMQQTITWFLVGYTVGQLIYAPLTSRWGIKTAVYSGITVQIISSLLCILAGLTHQYWLLVVGRLLVALGAGVGLKITFTLLNQFYEPKIASQKTAYLMMAFAVTPGLSVAIGGFLNTQWGWMSCFYAGALYGAGLLLLVSRLPETQTTLDLDAFKIKKLVGAYAIQFKNLQLVSGGLLMGAGSSFIYLFAAVAPFVAISIFGMSSEQYGLANLLPPIGLLVGSLLSANLIKKYKLSHLIFAGVLITLLGVVLMLIAVMMNLAPLFSLFLPTVLIYFGLCFIFSNASSLAMSHATDKAHGPAVMNFINMGFATFMVLSLSYFEMNIFVLPVVFLLLSGVLFMAFKGALKKHENVPQGIVLE